MLFCVPRRRPARKAVHALARTSLILLAGVGCEGLQDLNTGDPASSLVAKDAATPDDGGAGADAAADAGLPSVTCDGGLTACGAACVDTSRDRSNCGQCGRDCQGAACTGGSCEPITIAKGPLYASAIAVQGDDVFWTTDAAVYRCKKSGCGQNPVLLADNQNVPNGLAVDATSVYWTNRDAGTVVRCPIAGCSGTPITLATGQSQPAGLAVRGGVVYWVNNRGASVMSVSANGGSIRTIATSQGYPSSVAVDDSYVYWNASTGSIVKCPVGSACGTSPTPVAPASISASTIAIDGARVFCTTDTRATVESCPLTGCTKGTVVASSADFFMTWALVVDGGRVFFTTDPTTQGGVYSCPVGGCAGAGPTVHAIDETEPGGVAVDAKTVYYTTGSGLVRKVAR